MSKKIRLIILLFCIACFFIVAPLLVAYSMGYRFEIKKMVVVATGGIYVRTFPAADQIVIDSSISERPGLFANSVFVQSLLPENHTVSIKKTGYYDYFKTLPVQEKIATKLENVMLVKKSITFSDLANSVDYFSVAPNNQNIITALTGTKNISFKYFSANSQTPAQIFSITQAGKISGITWSDDSSKAMIDIKGANNDFYYLFDSTLSAQSNTQKATAIRLTYLDKNSQQIYFNSQAVFYIKNKTLYSAKGNIATPIINNIVSFKISGSSITWLSTKGALSNSDLSGKLIGSINLKDFSINSQKTYEISLISGNTFLKEGNTMFKLNPITEAFEIYNTPLSDYKIITSSDNKNLIYWNTDKIFLYSLADKKFTQLFSGSQIMNCQWLNNDYIIFTSEDKVIISEIDYRGNINTFTLPGELTISSTSGPKTISIKSPQEFFNSQDGKIYILTQNTLVLSEKITP